MKVKRLNEERIPYDVKEDLICKANLIVLYDHSLQDDIFIIKNPSKEEIIKISKVKYDDNKNPLNYDLNKSYYFVNIDNLIEIDYDDEQITLCEYFYTLKDFFLECYDRLTYDYHYNGKKEYSEDNEIALDNFIQNDNCPMHWFYKISDKNKSYLVDQLQKIKNSLKDFKTFVQTMKSLYVDSFCDCDSGLSYNLIDLTREKLVLGSKRTTIHFIKTLDEYYELMPDLIKARKERREKERKEWAEKIKNGEIEESLKFNKSKKELYENIMTKISKEVKKVLRLY